LHVVSLIGDAVHFPVRRCDV